MPNNNQSNAAKHSNGLATSGSRNELFIPMQVSDDLTVHIYPNSEHEFLMTTNEVAAGYDVAPNSVRSHKSFHPNELLEGKHFISGVDISDAGNLKRETTMWTKAGIIRLGMFIRSERAILFRDWAEKVILKALEAPKPIKALPPAPRRKHNRLTPDRLISIMNDVCQIKEDELRIRIAHKLTGGAL